MADPLTVSLGVGDVHLALVRFGDGFRLRVQVGGDEVADTAVDVAALREFVETVEEAHDETAPSYP